MDTFFVRLANLSKSQLHLIYYNRWDTNYYTLGMYWPQKLHVL